jgi:virginiamycin B lyase
MPPWNVIQLKRAIVAAVLTLSILPGAYLSAASIDPAVVSRSISELVLTATIRVGKTADWVAIAPDAVWVGSTGPFAAHRIDPKTNKLIATVSLPGEPCAGLATGLGSLWVPICGDSPAIAKIDLSSNVLLSVFKVNAVAAEGGVTTSSDSVWLVDKAGSLARIAPDTGAIREIVRVPTGSFNPLYSDGLIWVTRAKGSEVTVIDAVKGTVLTTVPTGPSPRFLTSGAGAVWTLNQGDGSLTRIDMLTRHATKTIALGTPGHGGDIGFGGGMIWTTVPQVPLSAIDAATATLRCRWTGPGGDSLGIGHGAIWLTDYHAGTISRIELEDTVARCKK